MEVDDVEISLFQDVANTVAMDYGPSGLLGGEARESTPATPQGVGADTLGLDQRLRHGAAVEERESVDVVDHLDAVTAPCQGVRQSLDEHRVAAEVVRRVEGRHHREAQTRQDPESLPRRSGCQRTRLIEPPAPNQ